MRAFAHEVAKLSPATDALARRKPGNLWVRVLLRSNGAIKLNARIIAMEFKPKEFKSQD
jgi:hypothetical protein